ncbi:putative NBD/HSP70 family sugar kinase [Rubricella aquisinus]|uniref:Putative NBD/HSP70 family sugar kinase n=1 Tax=Rubricella aquisinus TaxID=2028108 RepID=A0A840WZB1_9RHOB|nr:ROK family transcriptional regulator [Rubricella aquisinus]MBB5516480.1 putative NBD/HSP70 family sugar kinase [Rubricella aquisinus]
MSSSSPSPPAPAKATAGSNAERSRHHNRKVVLGYISANAPAGRAEIARASGLSTQAVSNIIADLEADGFLASQGRRKGARGQPPVQYAINPDGAAALGFELRPDALFVTLVDIGGAVRHSARIPLAASGPAEAAFEIMKAANTAIAQSGLERSRILGAGVVMPGPFGIELDRGSEAELHGWADTDPAVFLSNALEMPVIVENDATAAAIAERVRGVGAGLDTFCFVYFGTGLGLGIVARGQVMRGAFGNAGEIGHIVVEPGGRPCECGQSGCLEAYTSRLALRRMLAEAGVKADSAAEIEALHEAGAPALTAWLDSAAPPLSRAIAMLENLLDPQAVVLGGALPDRVLDDLIARLDLPAASVSNRPDRKRPRVLRGVSGRTTAALGAAALVIHDTITPSLEPS